MTPASLRFSRPFACEKAGTPWQRIRRTLQVFSVLARRRTQEKEIAARHLFGAPQSVSGIESVRPLPTSANNRPRCSEHWCAKDTITVPPKEPGRGRCLGQSPNVVCLQLARRPVTSATFVSPMLPTAGLSSMAWRGAPGLRFKRHGPKPVERPTPGTGRAVSFAARLRRLTVGGPRAMAQKRLTAIGMRSRTRTSGASSVTPFCTLRFMPVLSLSW